VISQTRYIKIISGVGAGSVVASRQLIMRVITQNPLIPPGVVMEFATPDSVGAYFGMQSEEYFRALAYFGFVSKSVTSPSSISFARWVNQTIAPMIVGDSLPKSLNSFVGITAGSLSINIGATVAAITPINLSQAESLTDVAATIQTAVRLNANPQLATATVTFNTNTNQFVLTGSVTGSGSLSVTPTNQAGDLSQITGLGTNGTILVAGQSADKAISAVSKSAGISNNMGSFVFATPNTPMSNEDMAEVSTWNSAQNNMYVYSIATSSANIGTLFELVKGMSGTALNVLSVTARNDFIEQSPCEILASTEFSQPGSAQNYMFYQFPNRTVTVSDDPTADAMDKVRANYIGVTQSAGQPLAFYQRGLLCGGPTAAVDMNTYANELWLKSALGTVILALLLAVPTLPASPNGAASVLGVMQPVFTTAGENGTFEPGKTIDAVQQQYITKITGDRTAWRQVQTAGYWISVGFSKYVNQNTGLTEWQAIYKLVYSKGDAIRFVSGQDIMS
jgi:hypothetical protein